MDSIPMVALTGQVARITSLIGNDAFQEADITGITRPIVKHNYIVKDIKDLAQTIKNAFHIALNRQARTCFSRPSEDVFTSDFDFKDYPAQPNLRGYKPTY